MSIRKAIRPLKYKTKILYLTGKPGVGKYTIAKVLASHYNLIICDNQLINNSIFELLQYDGYEKIPDFAWNAIGRIRSEIFEFLTKVPQKSYILTNNLFEDKGDRKLYEDVKSMANKRGSLFVPVKLLITQDAHLKRVTDPQRRERWKSIDPQDAYDMTPLLHFTHPNLLALDISHLSPQGAAEIIMAHTDKILQSLKEK